LAPCVPAQSSDGCPTRGLQITLPAQRTLSLAPPLLLRSQLRSQLARFASRREWPSIPLPQRCARRVRRRPPSRRQRSPNSGTPIGCRFNLVIVCHNRCVAKLWPFETDLGATGFRTSVDRA